MDARAFDELTEILDLAQFTREDVMRVSGLTPKRLEHLLDPKRAELRLDGRHVTPGTGRRRMFTGGDVLMIKVATIAGELGFPARWLYLLCERVRTHASARLRGFADGRHLSLATWPCSGDDWAVTPIFNGEPAGQLPAAFHLVDVDRLTDETVKQLRAILDGSEVPDFSVKFKPEASPFSPENDFFKAWAKDEQDRNIRVGLSHDETLEYERLSVGELQSHLDRDRYLELSDKHEAARLARVWAGIA